MPLSEADFTILVDTGCTACGNKTVIVEAIVSQKIPLLGGEPYGSPSWGYKGEELVNGTYRIGCESCKKDLYTSSVCSLCNAEGCVARALENENAFPLPAACAGCGNEMLTASAYVPATVVYEGKRAAKARTHTVPEDPGFHALRVECKECRSVFQRTRFVTPDGVKAPCPLCG
jgi:hypothetical protein